MWRSRWQEGEKRGRRSEAWAVGLLWPLLEGFVTPSLNAHLSPLTFLCVAGR